MNSFRMNFQKQEEFFNVETQLMNENPHAIITKSCENFIKRYQSRQTFSLVNFNHDLILVKEQIQTYKQHSYKILKQYSVFSQMDNFFRGIIDGQKYLLQFFTEKLKDKIINEENLSEKITTLTNTNYQKCSICGETFEKKNLDKLKNQIDMGFKDMYTYFMMDFQEISRMEEEARLFLMKKNTQIQALTHEQYVAKLQQMHENVKKTVQGIDQCLNDMLTFQEKVAQMHDKHKEEKKMSRRATTDLFSHKKFAYKMGIHFCALIKHLQKEIKNIRKFIVYKASQGTQTIQIEEPEIAKQEIEKLKDELFKTISENKEMRTKIKELQFEIEQRKKQIESLRDENQNNEDRIQELDKINSQNNIKLKSSKKFPNESKSSKQLNKPEKLHTNESCIEEEFLEEEGDSQNDQFSNDASTQHQFQIRKKNIEKISFVKSQNLSNLFGKSSKENFFQQINKDKKKNNTNIPMSPSALLNGNKMKEYIKSQNNSFVQNINQIISQPKNRDKSVQNTKKQSVSDLQQQMNMIEQIYEYTPFGLKKLYRKSVFLEKAGKFLHKFHQKEEIEKNKFQDELYSASIRKAYKKKSYLNSSNKYDEVGKENQQRFHERIQGILKNEEDNQKQEKLIRQKSLKEKNMRNSVDITNNLKIPQLKRPNRRQSLQNFNLNFIYSRGQIFQKKNSNKRGDSKAQKKSQSLDFEEKDFKMIFLEGQKKQKPIHKKTKSAFKFDDGLNSCQISYMNQIFTYLANIHLQDPAKYSKVKLFLLNPNEYRFGDEKMTEIMKGSCSSLLREAMYKIIMMHRECTIQGQLCRHLLYFLEKLKKCS